MTDRTESIFGMPLLDEAGSLMGLVFPGDLVLAILLGAK